MTPLRQLDRERAGSRTSGSSIADGLADGPRDSAPGPTAAGTPGVPVRRTRVLLVLPAAALAAVAGLSFDGAFTLSGIGELCVVSAAPPALIAAGSLLRRSRPLPLPLTLTVSAAGWAGLLPLIAAALAAPGTPGGTLGGTWQLLREGLTSAPKQLLTTVAPAAATAPFLLALGTLVWWASAWSAEAAVRRSGPLLPLAVPTLVLLAGTAAGVPAGSAAQLWPAALFVALVAIMITAQRALARSPVSGPGPGLLARAVRVLSATGIVAVVTGLAVGVTTVLPGLAGRPPADPRPLVTPPVQAATLLDPLSQVSAWLSGRPRLLFTVTTTDPVNLRWLVLDQYGGIGWSSSTSYLPAGTQLPADSQVTVPTQPVQESLQLTALPGMWLPAADHPARVTGIAARVDPASGVLATLDGSPAQGRAYQVVSDVAAPRLADLINAVPGAGPSLAGQRSLPPGLPPVVAGYGARAIAGAAYPYQEMVLLQDRLLRDFRYSPRAAPGESYGHLAIFVGGRHIGGPGVFATLFAVIARRAGFASRVAIGFTQGQPAGPGRYLVTTADALVWPEVYFSGLGWVPFYPLPRPGSAASRQAVRSLGEPASRSALDQRAASSGPAHATHPGASARVSVAPPATGPHGGTGGLEGAGVALCSLLALAAVYLAVAALLRALTRRRRRHHPDPRYRVAAAWQDALGRMRAAGGATVAALTPDEIAGQAATLLGPAAEQPLRQLAGLANAALFAAAAPTAADADAAWAAAVQVRRLARRRTSWRFRFTILLRPVPL